MGLKMLCSWFALLFLSSSLNLTASNGRSETISFAKKDLQEGAVLHREDSVRLKMSNSSDVLVVSYAVYREVQKEGPVPVLLANVQEALSPRTIRFSIPSEFPDSDFGSDLADRLMVASKGQIPLDRMLFFLSLGLRSSFPYGDDAFSYLPSDKSSLDVVLDVDGEETLYGIYAEVVSFLSPTQYYVYLSVERKDISDETLSFFDVDVHFLYSDHGAVLIERFDDHDDLNQYREVYGL